jgi:hypothetical protein
MSTQPGRLFWIFAGMATVLALALALSVAVVRLLWAVGSRLLGA